MKGKPAGDVVLCCKGEKVIIGDAMTNPLKRNSTAPLEPDPIGQASHAPRIKKLPEHLRRKRINYRLIRGWHRRLLTRLREDSQFLRTTVQAAFVLLCIWIGVEFALFVRWGGDPSAAAFSQRPPGAEGFLPISALISLKYWAEAGIINN